MTDIDLLPIIRIIHRSIREARTAGRNRAGETRQAVLAVMHERPDIRPDDVLTLVQGVQNGNGAS
jgi:hypothetical protein